MSDIRLKRWMMVIAFLICLLPFVSARQAEAATSNGALSNPYVQSDSTVKLGALSINESSYAGTVDAWDSVSISLPTYCELSSLTITGASAYAGANVTLTFNNAARTYTDGTNTYSYGSVACFVYAGSVGPGTPLTPGDSPAGSYGYYVQVTDDNRFTIGVTRASTSAGYFRAVISPTVYIRPMGPNDPTALAAALDAYPGGGFTTGSYTLATVATAGTTASVDAPLTSGTSPHYVVPVIGEGGGSVASIIVKENVAGSLTTSGTVTLSLPPGFNWNNADITQDVIVDWGFAAGDVTPSIITDSDGRSAIKLTINNSTTRPGRIIVNGSVSVDSSTALSGDILVDYGGTNPGVNPATLTVATYATGGKTAAQETTADITAGRNDQRIGQFAIQEQTPGDLSLGRTITLTLPDGAKWRTAPTVARQSGDGTVGPAGAFYADDSKVDYRVTAMSTIASTFIFKNGSVDLALDSPDTLDITIEGSGGVTGTVTVANIMQPLALTLEKRSVEIGTANQEIGDITIVEQIAGALRAKDTLGDQASLTLTLPAGVSFSQMPELMVSDGNVNLALSQAGLSSGNAVLTIPVKQSGSVPSTITISGIKLTLDRTVPGGDIKLSIGGTAIVQTADKFSGDLSNVDLVIAFTGSGGTGGVAVFIIDQPSYTLGGQTVAMDVAPYIKNGRTMIPLRFAANALGIEDNNILWDDATKTVTIIKGDHVVSLQIGKNELKINGASISIDAAPEIFSSRTMLPIRALGTALGATLEWNETDRSVTVSYNN
jgi:hypothetical protein